MNISSLLTGTTASTTGSGAAASQAATAASAVSPFLAQAEQRIQDDAGVTTAQISKFGILKSALSDAQGAAKSMTTLGSATTAADASTALANFFNNFNAAANAANSAASATGSSSESARAKNLVRDLKAALSSDPVLADDVSKLGLKVQSDGTLVQDPKKFAAALASDPSGTLAAMAQVGSKVDSVASNELSASGNVGAALSTLTRQSTNLAAQQSAFKALDQAMSAVSTVDPFTATDTSSQSSASSSFFESGLSAYHSNMTGF